MASYSSMQMPWKAQETLGLRPRSSTVLANAAKNIHDTQTPVSFRQANQYEGNHDGRRSPFSLQMPLQSSLYVMPLAKRCHQLETIISSCPASDLHDSFPDLVASIFGFAGHSGWQLHFLNPIQDSYDYHEVGRFLSPAHGSLFKMMDQLVTEHSAMYPLSLANLPAALQSSLQRLAMERKGYHGYSHAIAQGQTIEINALEYYIFHFAMFILQTSNHHELTNWSAVDDVLYIRLLNDYLQHFLPIHTRVTHGSQSPNSLGRSHQHSQRPEGFLSPYFRQQQQQHTSDIHWQNSRQATIATNSTKSESFIKLLIDVWLSLTHVSLQREKRTTPSSQDFFLPSVDHVRCIRQLVKHIHNFANSKIATPAHIDVSMLEAEPHAELQRKAVSMLSEQLYPFLCHLFIYWPIDPSFRMVLETWLSFIQPWRYPESRATPSPTRGYSPQAATPIDVDLSKWVGFITDNIQFYTSIFKLFMSRALCLDFETPKDAQLLYRVTKVYSQPRLGLIIADVEPLHRDTASSRQTMSSLNPLAINSYDRRRSNFNSVAMNDRLEGHPNPSETLFGDLYRPVVVRLVEKLASSLACSRQRRSSLALQNSKTDSIPMLKSAFNSFKSFFLINDNSTFADELELAANYTDRILIDLCCLFKIERPTNDTSRFHSDERSVVDGSHPSLPRPFLRHRHTTQQRFDSEGPPDHVMTESGPVLTYKGKAELVNGVRRFDVDLLGDPDLQPIRSYESALLVRSCHALSERINSSPTFANALNTLYFRCGFLSLFLQWLSGHTSNVKRNSSPRRLQKHSNTVRHDTDVVTTPNVRVSLRYLASYNTIAYIFLTFAILWFLYEVHPFTLLTIILFVFILLLFVHIRSDA